MAGLFRDDLATKLRDPEFAREYELASVRVTTVDAIINALDDARRAAGLSKAALARAIGAEPATIRRLFTAGASNPTLGTIATVAAALGLRVVVEPRNRDSHTPVAPVPDAVRGHGGHRPRGRRAA